MNTEYISRNQEKKVHKSLSEYYIRNLRIIYEWM